MNRRTFIRSGMRFTALSGLAFLGFSLGIKKKSSLVDPCKACAKINSCSKVLKLKENKEQKKKINCENFQMR